MKIKKNIIHKLAKGEKNGSVCHSRAPYKTENWKQVTCRKCLKKKKYRFLQVGNKIHFLKPGESSITGVGSSLCGVYGKNTTTWDKVTCKKCLKTGDKNGWAKTQKKYLKKKRIHLLAPNAEYESGHTFCNVIVSELAKLTENANAVNCPTCLELIRNGVPVKNDEVQEKNEEKNVIDYIIDIFKESVGLHNVTPEEIQIAFEKVDDHVILEIAMEIVKYRLDIK